MNNITIRKAAPYDGAALLKIYAPYVTTTAITFEYDVPTIAEFTARIECISAKYPYLVAETDDGVVGYAYASPLGEREAYGWSAETSIYVRRDCKRMGVGSRLYAALVEALKAQGVRNMYACIAWPEPEDEYLTRDSVAFHERQGFVKVGQLHKCGCKFGRWYDTVWMEKFIGQHGQNPQKIKNFK